MGSRFERQQEKLAKLHNNAAADGNITYDELVRREQKVLDKMEKACPHNDTETETIDGKTVTWCNDCTGQVS